MIENEISEKQTDESIIQGAETQTLPAHPAAEHAVTETTPLEIAPQANTLPAFIAEVCHEANRIYCKVLGDFSQVPWEQAPIWAVKSALAGVDFHLANPDATPAASHESWLAQKAADGWKYGLVKDVEKKEHPCFLPFNDLPTAQQVKDKLFKSIVDALR